jgi:hypothetical protein
MEMLKPIIPHLLANKPGAAQVAPVSDLKGGQKPKMNKEEYAQAVKEGKIDEKAAYEDFLLEGGEDAKKIPYAIFKKNFDIVKETGKFPEKLII